ncbi:MAG: DUF4339 domain-containing protein [Verrucomicrobiales bacterium]|nr:DUF4339 domain-containing protein [Verrucomicrobiales bacterium]
MTTTIAADFDPLVMSETESTENAGEPEEILFSVMRRGEAEPSGPHTQEEILQMLNDGLVAADDFVFYEGMADWQPIEEVFEIQEQISHFIDDGQDREKVAECFREVSRVLASGEDIYYIAAQEKAGLLSKARTCVIMTNKRLFLLHERRGGNELESYRWDAVTNTLMKDEGHGLATFSVLLHREKRLDVPHLPLAQVHRLFKLFQELSDGVAS